MDEDDCPEDAEELPALLRARAKDRPSESLLRQAANEIERLRALVPDAQKLPVVMVDVCAKCEMPVYGPADAGGEFTCEHYKDADITTKRAPCPHREVDEDWRCEYCGREVFNREDYGRPPDSDVPIDALMTKA